MNISDRHPGRTLAAATLIAAAAVPSCADAPQVRQRMNVVYILADDMGYGDLSLTGQQRFSTPNIDRLAAQGMLFTQHYAGCAVSAPSRSSLMTGQHTGHTPIRGNRERPDGEGQEPLPAGTYTMARMFAQAGYATGAFGKWGLGYPGSVGAPEQMGFDRFFGYNCQRQSHRYYPTHLWDTGRKVPLEANAAGACGAYAPDLIQEQALAFIRENRGRPFFLYLPYTLPHAELIAPQDSLLLQFRGAFEEQPYRGIDYAAETLPEGYCSQQEPYAAFAAMMTRLDRYVGEVMEELDRQGIADRTWVIFTSDNGPHREGGANPDYFRSYGELRGIKRDLYEGGIRLPMIVRLPGRVAAGVENRCVAAMWDMLPTFAQIAGATIPDSVQLDGISLIPTLTGDDSSQPQHDYLYWEFHEGGETAAVRKGDWKGVIFGTGDRARCELYDLAADPGERCDLAGSRPQIAEQLLRIAREAHTEP